MEEIHSLKILNKYFKKIVKNEKNWEYRKNDRNYQIGDILVLNEINKNNYITGRTIKVKVVDILSEKDFNSLIGYVIMTFKIIEINLKENEKL